MYRVWCGEYCELKVVLEARLFSDSSMVMGVRARLFLDLGLTLKMCFSLDNGL